MNILIVDDSNDKIVSIVSTIREISETFNVETVIDNISAQKKLIERKYDLLVVDLLLPLRKDEAPIVEGGLNLINEIQRVNRIKSPTYIVGITQYEEYSSSFPSIWNVLHYSPSSSEWKFKLKQIIEHILKSNAHSSEEVKIRKPTIYLEGLSDESVFRQAVKIFCPELDSKIIIKSERGSGASWVARQIIIWGHSLHCNNNGDEYLKAVGLLDGDQAGNEAKSEVNRKIEPSSASSKTYKIFQLSPSYARELIPLCKKGINIPVTLEEMFPVKLWEIAKSKDWLESRQDPDSLLSDPRGWDKMKMSLGEHLSSLGLSKIESIYLEKFKLSSKEDFVKFILSLPFDEQKEALKNFDPLIQDIANYLFPSSVKRELG